MKFGTELAPSTWLNIAFGVLFVNRHKYYCSAKLLFGPKRYKVKRDWRKQRNEERNDLY
jgi:hypothetical protein